jgi:hypothetical protein
MLLNVTSHTCYLMLSTPTRANYCNTRYFRTFQTRRIETPIYALAKVSNHPTAERWNLNDRTLRAHLVPLRFNKRKIDEFYNKRGAVHEDPDGNVSIVLGPYTVLRSDGAVVYTDPASTLNPRGSTYKGHLPDDITDLMEANRGAITMEDLSDHYYETEYVRGPRIEVYRHHLQLDDIDPQTVTLSRAKEVALPLLREVEEITGLNILELPEDDERATLAARLAIAATKFGVKKLKQINSIPTAMAYTLFYAGSWETKSKRPLFPHKNPDDPRLVRYYASYDDLLRNRTSVAKPGKVVRQLVPANYEDERVKAIANRIAMEITPSRFEVLTDPDDIIEAYLSGPSSCATHETHWYSTLRDADAPGNAHPSSVYGGDSDTALAVCFKGDMPVCRTVINTHTREYVRIYTMDNCADAEAEFKNWLHENGYTRSNDALVGACLRWVEVEHESDNVIVMPYIDVGGKMTLFVPSVPAVIVTGDNFNERLTPAARRVMERVADERMPVIATNVFYNAGGVTYSELMSRKQTTFGRCEATGEITPDSRLDYAVMADGRVGRVSLRERQNRYHTGYEIVHIDDDNTARVIQWAHQDFDTDTHLVQITPKLATDLFGVLGTLRDPTLLRDREAHRAALGDARTVTTTNSGRLAHESETFELNGRIHLLDDISLFADGDTYTYAVGEWVDCDNDHKRNILTQLTEGAQTHVEA